MSVQTQLSIDVEKHDKGLVLCVNGRVDGTNASMLDEVIRDQLEAGQSSLVFDFTNLSYISSAGLRVLLVAARECQSRDGKSVFCGLSKMVAEVFEISGFDKILTVLASRDEALESF